MPQGLNGSKILGSIREKTTKDKAGKGGDKKAKRDDVQRERSRDKKDQGEERDYCQYYTDRPRETFTPLNISRIEILAIMQRRHNVHWLRAMKS